MNTTDLIPVKEFCSIHETEISFISSLSESGLVEIIHIEEAAYIPSDSIASLEKYTRLHHDLNINAEGIHAIIYLLERIEKMQHDLHLLKNRLQIYEE